jgi:hypothetical protein
LERVIGYRFALLLCISLGGREVFTPKKVRG